MQRKKKKKIKLPFYNVAFYGKYEILICSLIEKGNVFCMKRYCFITSLDQRF